MLLAIILSLVFILITINYIAEVYAHRRISEILGKYNPTGKVNEDNLYKLYLNITPGIMYALRLTCYDAFRREVETLFFQEDERPNLIKLHNATQELWSTYNT